MQFRHEIKHRINYCDMLVLRQRLSAVMEADSHSENGRYMIRSLYFDTLSDRALREKLDGVNEREKFRMRYYNGDTSFICLEKKSKLGGLCSKQSVRITEEQARLITGCDIESLAGAGGLLTELYSKMTSEGLKPKTIVDYTREPYVFAPGNVRVTLDHDIRTGLSYTDFLDPLAVTVPVPEEGIILEVKWDEFLPDIIRDAVSLPDRNASAFSKYAVCRSYG